jgi:hypothetical protein
MNPTGFFVALAVAVVAVNGLSLYLYNQVLNLVCEKAGESERLVSDNVARNYAKYLFGQVMAGSFFTPNTVVIGNPESDHIVRSVKRSPQYQRITELASWVRNLPINFVPYCV